MPLCPSKGRLLSHVEDTSDLYGEFNRYLAAEEAIIQSMSDEGHPTAEGIAEARRAG
jgi:hypothetical protein